MPEKIGVYVCHCGTNIAGVVNIEETVKAASQMKDVVVAKEYKFMCSDPGQDIIRKDIKDEGLTRVVVAACSPRMHEPTFRKTCESAGLNQYFFQMANIREHCSWVHEDKDFATKKAIALISAAVNRVSHQEALDVKYVNIIPATLVVGGGIAGIQASLDIANAGKKVYLVEKTPTIGGHMAKFDKTFPTLDCAACILTPKMVQVAQNENIELMTYSEVVDVSGYVGNFKVKIRKKARYVDINKCTGCGLCYEKCPIKVPSEFDEGLTTRKAIYVPFPQAVPNKATIDKENCRQFQEGKKCGVCKKICPADAVDYEMKDEIVEVEVGNIIVATGFKPFDATRIPHYGYGKYENVITSLQFERLTNASGPTGGKLLTKQGKEPESVGIIHCVGSRDINYNEYCSRVCCMYSLKFAHLVKEKLPSAEVYNFYIDLRCFGKGYEEFYNRCLDEGVNFIRGRGAEVTDVAESPEEEGKLIIKCEDTLLGVYLRVPVDMVILAVGLEPSDDSKEIARLFGISKGRDGFFLELHPKLAPVNTTTDGVFIAGACQGPKDIPDTVAQGEAAASCALSMIMKGKIEVEAITAQISEELCSGCRICNTMCPYSAIEFDQEKKVSKVVEALCKACGTCGSACPSGAIKSRHFTSDMIISEIEGLLAA